MNLSSPTALTLPTTCLWHKPISSINNIPPLLKNFTKGVGLRVPWWLSELRAWCCHCCSSGQYCGLGSIPGLGTTACHRCSQKKKEKRKEKKKKRNGSRAVISNGGILPPSGYLAMSGSIFFFFLLNLQHVEVHRLGIKPVPQQQPEPQQ